MNQGSNEKLKLEKKQSNEALEKDKQHSRKKSKKILELKNVLKFGIPQRLIYKSNLNSITDLVQKYGAQFKEVKHEMIFFFFGINKTT